MMAPPEYDHLSPSTPVSDHQQSAAPVKTKGRRRLLRGLQRISSSPSLPGLGRSKSAGNPYSTRSTLSCVSLVGGPSQPSTNPQPSLSARSTSLLPSSVTDIALNEASNGQLAVRKVDNARTTPSSATAALPPELRCKHDAHLARTHVKPRTCRWDKLPYEVCVHVLSFLRPKELVRVSRVSQAFHKSCFDGQLWTSLDASEFYQEIPADSLARIILAAGPFINDLNLRGCVQVEHYKRAEVIVRACKNLVNATLEGCRNIQKHTLHALLRNNDKLVHLNLTGLAAVSNTSCKIIAESCPSLEALNVSWCEKVDARGLKVVIDRCTKLKDLRAGEVRGFDSFAMAESIFKTNRLERLVLCGCVELTDEALRVMMHGTDPEFDILTDRPMVPPRKLRHLDLSRCKHLSSVGVRCLGHVVPALEGLQLSGCKSLTDAALEPILATTPRLTHLELEDLEDLTNSILSEHLAKAPCAANLKHLSLSYCEKMSDVGVLPVMQKCVALESVDLDNTRISDLVLAEAASMVGARCRESTTAEGEGPKPWTTLQMAVYDCPNVTWTGIREILFRNTQMMAAASRSDSPAEFIGIKCFYGFQMTVDEHHRRLLRGDISAAARLERKWAEYMQASEEAGAPDGPGYRRRRRRAREAHALLDDDEGPGGRRRARTLGSCTVM
ncbi:F-box/LRR-repeat protein 2 [Ophiocordyceps camponoti-floridani]|uniref:F-box/LRR-repeat protein 2 n=1 Tax=Ophiocordyceps camponoti-floridani TaxID=2030778 RepID=A0A8H4Q1D7_9HYPO|nr:F-box/LRR-repeat protein 2 [Ophiocordyceps camponoti-floridani]